MTASNMPVLFQNSLLQYSTEIARKAWIWFAETRGHGLHYAADRYATEVERLVLSIRPMLATANQTYDAASEVMDDLLRFILVRHANWCLGGNITPEFLK